MEPIPGLDALLSELPGAIEQDIWGCDPDLLAVFDGFQTEISDGSNQPAASEEVEGGLINPCATPAHPGTLPQEPIFQKPAPAANVHNKAPTPITITTTVATTNNTASPSCSPACPRPAPSVHANDFQQQQQHPGYPHDPGNSSRHYNVRPRRAISPPSCSSDDTGAMSSDSGGDDDAPPAISKRQAAANKRKAPEVDWRAITDPAERRKQRRLAKNRVTAARSRERKKEQWAEMQASLAALQADNASLKAALAAARNENAQLKQQLGSLNRGLAVAASTTGQGAEPAALQQCLVNMHLVCPDSRGGLPAPQLARPLSPSVRRHVCPEGVLVFVRPGVPQQPAQLCASSCCGPAWLRGGCLDPCPVRLALLVVVVPGLALFALQPNPGLARAPSCASAPHQRLVKGLRALAAAAAADGKLYTPTVTWPRQRLLEASRPWGMVTAAAVGVPLDCCCPSITQPIRIVNLRCRWQQEHRCLHRGGGSSMWHAGCDWGRSGTGSRGAAWAPVHVLRRLCGGKQAGGPGECVSLIGVPATQAGWTGGAVWAPHGKHTGADSWASASMYSRGWCVVCKDACAPASAQAAIRRWVEVGGWRSR